MASIGNLVIDIIGNTDGLKKSLSGAETMVSGFGGGLKKAGGMAMTAMGGAAVAGATAAGAAIVGAAVGGVRAFADFETGMNEVFTLLPGMSKDAMKKMQGDVLTFSKKMGVLPEDTIPALYQALSAGVPADNVFGFLEKSQQAAKGGVTGLSTAVDGITSVVNAYGSDMVDAAQASDQMFTAVRLGKTNFEELSGSLYNVLPTAAAAGVGFGDITAGLAAMTSQGVPTAVATTQLRQMLVELGKDGSDTSKIFEEISGQTFTDFIAGGGDMQGALALMGQAADENGVSISDLFGSVEAGNAALALSGSEAFNTALEEMDASSGATEKAFEQMNQGGSASMDKFKANASAALIEIGDAMTGATTPITEAMVPALDKFGAWFTETGAPKIKEFTDNAVKWITEFIEKSKPIIDEFQAKWDENVEPAMLAVQDAVKRVSEAFGINQEEMSGMNILLDGLKKLLDAVVIGLQFVAIGAQAFAWLAEKIGEAWDVAKDLWDQISQIWDLLTSGDADILGGLAGWAEGIGSTWGVPGFATGGVVPGAIGEPVLAMVHGGEEIIPPGSGGGAGTVLNVTVNANDAEGGARAGNAFVDALRLRGMVTI